jgi:hypothetical protein
MICNSIISIIERDFPHCCLYLIIDFFTGAIKAKTIVMNSNADPVYPLTQCEILLNIFEPFELRVSIVHVDSLHRKDVCLGRFCHSATNSSYN